MGGRRIENPPPSLLRELSSRPMIFPGHFRRRLPRESRPPPSPLTTHCSPGISLGRGGPLRGCGGSFCVVLARFVLGDLTRDWWDPPPHPPFPATPRWSRATLVLNPPRSPPIWGWAAPISGLVRLRVGPFAPVPFWCDHSSLVGTGGGDGGVWPDSGHCRLSPTPLPLHLRWVTCP